MNYNPMIDYQRNQLLAQQAMIQNQLNQMNHMQSNAAPFPPYPPQQNQFPNYSQQPQQQTNNPQFFVRPVGNIDEAKSYPVDPNIIYIFPDTSDGKIYLKQMDMSNGKSMFYIYAMQNIQEEKRSDPMEEIKEKLTKIENILGGQYGNKSIQNVSSDETSDAGSAAANDGSISEPKSADVSANSRHGKR